MTDAAFETVVLGGTAIHIQKQTKDPKITP